MYKRHLNLSTPGSELPLVVKEIAQALLAGDWYRMSTEDETYETMVRPVGTAGITVGALNLVRNAPLPDPLATTHVVLLANRVEIQHPGGGEIALRRPPSSRRPTVRDRYVKRPAGDESAVAFALPPTSGRAPLEKYLKRAADRINHKELNYFGLDTDLQTAWA
jgi:hypothetical protein